MSEVVDHAGAGPTCSLSFTHLPRPFFHHLHTRHNLGDPNLLGPIWLFRSELVAMSEVVDHTHPGPQEIKAGGPVCAPGLAS